jgi:spore coat protein SA
VRDLKRYGRAESQLPVIVHGIDTQRFRVETRQALRESARRALGLKESDFCALLVGNALKKKGLPCLLEALGRLDVPSIKLLVVGRDRQAPFRSAMIRLHLEQRVKFLPPRPEIEFYYAAADLYVCASLEDAFALPPLEAMACGVPSIVSSQAGVSEIISHGVDGFILDDPRDSGQLADLIALVYENKDLRERIGEAAAKTARKYTWDNNAEQLGQLFQEVLRRKDGTPAVAPVEQPVQ